MEDNGPRWPGEWLHAAVQHCAECMACGPALRVRRKRLAILESQLVGVPDRRRIGYIELLGPDRAGGLDVGPARHLGHPPIDPRQQHQRAAAGGLDGLDGPDRDIVDKSAVEAWLSADHDQRHEW